jgi:hypothetical protein
VRENADGDIIVFDVVTGIPDGPGPFASHGHSVRLTSRPRLPNNWGPASEVGRWRGACWGRSFSSALLPNHACAFQRTWLSGDFCVSVAAGCPVWMVLWQAWQTRRVASPFSHDLRPSGLWLSWLGKVSELADLMNFGRACMAA